MTGEYASPENLPPEVAEALRKIRQGLVELIEATRGRPEYRQTYAAALRTLGHAVGDGLPIGTGEPDQRPPGSG